MNDAASNLDRLATLLEGLPHDYLHFDMESYFHDPRTHLHSEIDEMMAAYKITQPVEGMCACALGHSIAAGVMMIGSTWREAAQRAYAIDDDAFDYLFGGEWYVRDNTPVGAARRIRKYLAHGVPEGWQHDEDDLCLA